MLPPLRPCTALELARAHALLGALNSGRRRRNGGGGGATAAAADGMSSPLLSVSFIGLIFDTSSSLDYIELLTANSRDMPFDEIF